MAQTLSSALSAAITFKTQKKVLANLRAALVFADDAYAEQGEFDSGTDTLLFTNVPDLPTNVTALTEGAPRTPRALTMGTVTVSTVQYGDAVAITDVAKVKSPIEVSTIASERITRQSLESLDLINRDVIAAGGTAFYGGTSNAARADLASGDLADAATLRKLRATMFKNKIPAFADGYYRLWISPDVGYDLRSDTDTGGWIDVNKYATPETLLKGELGRMEGFRIMEVVNAPTFASTTTVHASIAVGAIKGWGSGELQSLRTYHIAPGGDHTDYMAQEELVSWKVMFGVAVLNNTFYYRMETAATTI